MSIFNELKSVKLVKQSFLKLYLLTLEGLFYVRQQCVTQLNCKHKIDYKVF